jgi:hypothetical protein
LVKNHSPIKQAGLPIYAGCVRVFAIALLHDLVPAYIAVPDIPVVDIAGAGNYLYPYRPESLSPDLARHIQGSVGPGRGFVFDQRLDTFHSFQVQSLSEKKNKEKNKTQKPEDIQMAFRKYEDDDRGVESLPDQKAGSQHRYGRFYPECLAGACILCGQWGEHTPSGQF